MKSLVLTIQFAVYLSLISVGMVHAAPDGAERQAQALFRQFIALAHAFDPAVADLYADEARIVSVRTYPDGQQRTFKMRGAEYKGLIREAMPIAKVRGDISTYADVSYRPEGARVRVHATRYSALKQYASSYSLLLGPDASGMWLIYEEHSTTKP